MPNTVDLVIAVNLGKVTITKQIHNTSKGCKIVERNGVISAEGDCPGEKKCSLIFQKESARAYGKTDHYWVKVTAVAVCK